MSTSTFDANGAATWQDDLAVSACFLCHSHYTFFNRRHHCRKCGRVVCASCSDRPVKYFPNTYVVSPHGSRVVDTSFEMFRTCDECVDEIRMIRRALFTTNLSVDNNSINSSSSSLNVMNYFDPHSHEHERDHIHYHDHDNDSTTKYSTRTHTRIVDSSTNSSATNLAHSHHRRIHGRGGTLAAAGSDDTESDLNLCPVCATDLLKLYINAHKRRIDEISHEDFDAFKETHINDCLTHFDFNTENQRFNSPESNHHSHPRNKMLVYNIPPIPKPKYETIPIIDEAPISDGTSEEATVHDSVHNSQSGGISPSSLTGQEGEQVEFSQLDTIIGSVTSTSTIQPSAEKISYDDVIDNECVICLEDLKPGDKVGRLECLCVFHYKCIKDWFNKKGYGECPVHFLHK